MSNFLESVARCERASERGCGSHTHCRRRRRRLHSVAAICALSPSRPAYHGSIGRRPLPPLGRLSSTNTNQPNFERSRPFLQSGVGKDVHPRDAPSLARGLLRTYGARRAAMRCNVLPALPRVDCTSSTHTHTYTKSRESRPRFELSSHIRSTLAAFGPRFDSIQHVCRRFTRTRPPRNTTHAVRYDTIRRRSTQPKSR